MPKQQLDDPIDPDSDAPEPEVEKHYTEYWAIALIGLFLIPWFFGVLYIVKIVSHFWRR